MKIVTGFDIDNQQILKGILLNLKAINESLKELVEAYRVNNGILGYAGEFYKK